MNGNEWNISMATIVGADEAAREAVRRRLPPGTAGTIALVRGREDWARINRLEGPVAILVFDRAYAGDAAEGGPIFHIEDLSSAAAYLTAMQRFDEPAAAFADEAW